jgi:hypothetical protein
MKQLEASRRKAKPLWFWAVCPQTGQGSMFKSENGFLPKAGEPVPSKQVSDWAEQGEWFVVVVFNRQFQRLMSVLEAFDHFADGEPLGFSTGIFQVIQSAIASCVTADRKGLRQQQLPGSVTIQMLQQISAPNSSFLIVSGPFGQPAQLMPVTQLDAKLQGVSDASA